MQEWNNYLNLYPDDAAGLSNRGNVRLNRDLEGSIDDQNKAINLNPREIDPYINRGIAEEALVYGLKRKMIICLLFRKIAQISQHYIT